MKKKDLPLKEILSNTVQNQNHKQNKFESAEKLYVEFLYKYSSQYDWFK